MKRVKTAFVIFSILSLSSFVQAEKETPWSFSNVAVVNLDARGLSIVRSPDDKGVLLFFEKWKAEYENTIAKSLEISPLQYKLHHGLQSEMALEIYSISNIVDFATRANGKQVQLLVGEVRPERTIWELLLPGEKLGELPDGAMDDIRKGQLSNVKRFLKQRPRSGKGRPYITRARRAVMVVAYRGPAFARCPRLPVRIKEDADKEGIFLSAWCQYRAGRIEAASEYIDYLAANEPDDSQKKRMAILNDKIVAVPVMVATRYDRMLDLAENAVRTQKKIFDGTRSYAFVELVGRGMIASGISKAYSRLVQPLLAGTVGDREVLELAPIASESYLASNDFVRASDTATFFLEKRKMPRWFKGRLLRVRGHSSLQEGDWADANKDFTEARPNVNHWNIDDELASIEAYIYSNPSMTPVSKRLNKILHESSDEFTRSIDDWFARLWGQVELSKGNLPSREVLTKLPSQVLYEAAISPIFGKRLEASALLLDIAAERSDGWGKVAQLEKAIGGYRAQIGEVKKAMEAMK